MEHASTVDIGERKRHREGINEDSIATAVFENHHRHTSRPVGVFVLGDGVGGEASGDIASAIATTVIRKRVATALLGPATDVYDRFDLDAYEGTPPTVDEGVEPESVLSEDRIRSVIQKSINEANKHVQAFARELGGRPATTIVVGVYHDGRLHYGWVGDSRLYLLNERHGRIDQLTRDHAVTNELMDRGEIDDEEYARVHGDATAITNAIGGSAHGNPHVDVDFGTVEVYREDVIMFTSDGLIDAYPDIASLREEYLRAEDTAAVREKIRETLVTDDEILEIVTESDTLPEAVERLVSFANDRGGKDNLSITLARDPTANQTPESIDHRSDGVDAAVVEPAGLTDQTTQIEAAETDSDEEPEAEGSESTDTADDDSASDAESTSSEEPRSDEEAEREGDESDDEAFDVVSVGGGDGPRAAIAVMETETIYAIGDAVTVGSGVDEIEPDVDVTADDESIIEPYHAGIERDGDEWYLRDTSSSGTFLEIDTGEWLLLLSNDGAELHRKHGFDPEATAEQNLNERYALEAGMAFTLEDPRDDESVHFRFYPSVEQAIESTAKDRTTEREFATFRI